MNMKWVELNLAVYCIALYKKSEYTYQDMVYINACYVLKHAETLNEIFSWPLWIKSKREEREREREREKGESSLEGSEPLPLYIIVLHFNFSAIGFTGSYSRMLYLFFPCV